MTHELRDDRFLLTMPSGIAALVSTRGAALVALAIPDRNGVFADVVLGYDTVADYAANTGFYFGATIGRVANRVDGATFELDDAQIHITRNHGARSLHGGEDEAFDRVVWSASHVKGEASDAVVLRHTSHDGAEGYPGSVDATVTYTLLDSALRIEWHVTVGGRTPLNLTNHAYWNLAGAGHSTVLGHELLLAAPSYTPVRADLIPTGAFAPVAGTPLDFRTTRRIGERIESLGNGPHDGYDHNLVFDATRDVAESVARLRDPGSGRVLEMFTDDPGVQLYSGNFMTSTRGKGGIPYGWRSGLCLEPRAPPDAIHHPAFGSIIVEPGVDYRRAVTFRFSAD